MCREGKRNDRFAKVFVNVYVLAASRSPTPKPPPQIPPTSPLFPLSMRFLEWLVTSFSFSFIYILMLSSLVVYNDCF